MPSKSQKQHNLMEAVAHGGAKEKGIPQGVGMEFEKADKAAGVGAAGTLPERAAPKPKGARGTAAGSKHHWHK